MSGGWTQNGWDRFSWGPLRLGRKSLVWRSPWTGKRAVPLSSCTTKALELRKITENLRQVGLDRPSEHQSSRVNRGWLQTAPSRPKCFPSYRDKRFLLLWWGRRTMESPDPRWFVCYHVPRYEDTWLQHLQLRDMVMTSRPPDGACIFHHRAEELFKRQHTVSDGQATFPIRRGSRTPRLRPVFHITWVTCADQVSCLSRVTPRYLLFRDSVLALRKTGPAWAWRLAVLAKSIAMLFETLIAILQSRSQCSSLLR
jgi:hypothetical protein